MFQKSPACLPHPLLREPQQCTRKGIPSGFSIHSPIRAFGFPSTSFSEIYPQHSFSYATLNGWVSESLLYADTEVYTLSGGFCLLCEWDCVESVQLLRLLSLLTALGQNWKPLAPRKCSEHRVELSRLQDQSIFGTTHEGESRFPYPFPQGSDSRECASGVDPL